MVAAGTPRFPRCVEDRHADCGLIVEQGPPEQVLNDPRHEETTHFLRRFLDR